MAATAGVPACGKCGAPCAYRITQKPGPNHGRAFWVCGQVSEAARRVCPPACAFVYVSDRGRSITLSPPPHPPSSTCTNTRSATPSSASAHRGRPPRPPPCVRLAPQAVLAAAACPPLWAAPAAAVGRGGARDRASEAEAAGAGAEAAAPPRTSCRGWSKGIASQERAWHPALSGGQQAAAAAAARSVERPRRLPLLLLLRLPPLLLLLRLLLPGEGQGLTKCWARQ